MRPGSLWPIRLPYRPQVRGADWKDAMLTRLEADGFKNLLGLKVDLGPFTCIAGVNGAGKSNVFDAIQFLSLLASRSLLDAAQEVRGVVRGDRLGDPRDLFWNGYAAGERRMRFAAEMIVPKDVEDDFGRMATASITYLRYELELGYIPPTGVEKIGRLRLLSERLGHINLRDAASRLRFPHSAARFRRAVLLGRRSGTAFISTSLVDGQPVVSIHQDGGSRGLLPLPGHPRPSCLPSRVATTRRSWRLAERCSHGDGSPGTLGAAYVRQVCRPSDHRRHWAAHAGGPVAYRVRERRPRARVCAGRRSACGPLRPSGRRVAGRGG